MSYIKDTQSKSLNSRLRFQQLTNIEKKNKCHMNLIDNVLKKQQMSYESNRQCAKKNKCHMNLIDNVLKKQMSYESNRQCAKKTNVI